MILVRDAEPADVPALCWIRHSAVVHQDRMRDAATEPVRYLVGVVDGVPVAWGLLVLAQPKGWPAVSRLPQVLDVVVCSSFRGKGIATRIIRECQAIARAAGFDELWLGLDSEGNVRARSLYEYLGYFHDGEAPIRADWSFEDSAGVIHRGEDWLIYLRRDLTS